MENKGFSLIELVVVIAIMAVLIGVLAPNFMKYYNNSGVVTDVTNANEMAKALAAAIAGQEGASVPAHIQGKGGTVVTGVDGLTVLPYCKTDREAEWDINTSFDEGVVQISLRGYVIFPETAGGNAYYNAFYAP